MTDKQKTERVQLVMTPAEVRAVDDWSFEKRVRGRSEAIRRLLDRGRPSRWYVEVWSPAGRAATDHKTLGSFSEAVDWLSERMSSDQSLIPRLLTYEELSAEDCEYLSKHNIQLQRI